MKSQVIALASILILGAAMTAWATCGPATEATWAYGCYDSQPVSQNPQTIDNSLTSCNAWSVKNGSCGNTSAFNCDPSTGTLYEYTYVYQGTPGHCSCASTYEATVNYNDATDGTGQCGG